MSMWCIYMCAHMSCGVIMLFTCTLVRSHPDSREGVRCEIQPTEINSKVLGWTWQQDACSEREARKRLSLGLERGHEGRIREVLQEDGCSSMGEISVCSFLCNIVCFHNMPCKYPCLGKLIHDIDCCFVFSQGKNKPWLPWVYALIQHRCEQFYLLQDSFIFGYVSQVVS